jgi:hypothetical protein
VVAAKLNEIFELQLKTKTLIAEVEQPLGIKDTRDESGKSWGEQIDENQEACDYYASRMLAEMFLRINDGGQE